MKRMMILAALVGLAACGPRDQGNAPIRSPANWNQGRQPQPAPQPQQPRQQQALPPMLNPMAWIPILMQPFQVPAGTGTAPPPGTTIPAGTTPPAGTASPGGAPVGTAPGAGAAMEAEVLLLVNQRRQQGASCGGKAFGPAAPLMHDGALQQAARAHSQDMAARNYFDHTTPEGRTVADRLRAAGFHGKGYGENIAAGEGTAAATVQQWMDSPGHCENIMDPGFRLLGVGYAQGSNSSYGHYWTQNFGG